MKKKRKLLRSKKIEIENIANRTVEQKGFDDMAAITLGDDRKVYKPTASKDLLRTDNDSKSFYTLLQKEDREKNWIVLILGIVSAICVAAVIIVGMIIEHREEQIDGKIRVNYSASDLEEENYKDVIEKLKIQGFTNIETEIIDDLITGWIKDDGEVEEVVIDGDTTFSSDSRYLPDVEIVIRYHTFSSD